MGLYSPISLLAVILDAIFRRKRRKDERDGRAGGKGDVRVR